MGQQQNDPWVTLGYEVEMFRRLLHDLGPGRQSLPPLPWEITCAITESALLHARQLADILRSHKPDPTDIALKDLLPGFEPTRLEELKRVYGNRHSGICHTLNKFAMHASTLRTESYDYTSVLLQLGGIIEDIVCEIEAQRGSTAFEWGSGEKSVATLKLSTSAITHVPTSQVFKPS